MTNEKLSSAPLRRVVAMMLAAHAARSELASAAVMSAVLSMPLTPSEHSRYVLGCHGSVVTWVWTGPDWPSDWVMTLVGFPAASSTASSRESCCGRPPVMEYTRLSPTLKTMIPSPLRHSPATVVPSPSSSVAAPTPRTWSLANVIVEATSSTVRHCGAPSAITFSAVLLAMLPPACPPMPSATTQTNGTVGSKSIATSAPSSV